MPGPRDGGPSQTETGQAGPVADCCICGSSTSEPRLRRSIQADLQQPEPDPSRAKENELGSLFSAARSKNKRLNITGALLISGDWFAQTLEGEEATVRALFARIERDGRHEHVTLLEDQRVPGRVFARWAMARVSADGAPDIPLIAHTDGISPAASRGTTPEQEAILDIMRKAIRGDAYAPGHPAAGSHRPNASP